MTKTVATPGERSRTLIRSVDRATLATAMNDDGWPYGSLVMVACGQDAAPLLMISDLAEHTRNLGESDRASLLFDGTGGLDNPLTGARVTVLGRLSKCDDPLLLARYVAHHPDAEIYAGFTDFHLFRMEIERAHIVAGFGEISWVDAADVSLAKAPPQGLIEAEAEIVAHMNEDHGDAVELYATALLGRTGDGWTMTGIDPEGLDLRRGGEIARLAFGRPVDGPQKARAELVKLAKKARSSGH